jgi:hypothetical protein
VFPPLIPKCCKTRRLIASSKSGHCWTFHPCRMGFCIIQTQSGKGPLSNALFPLWVTSKRFQPYLEGVLHLEHQFQKKQSQSIMAMRLPAFLTRLPADTKSGCCVSTAVLHTLLHFLGYRTFAFFHSPFESFE